MRFPTLKQFAVLTVLGAALSCTAASAQDATAPADSDAASTPQAGEVVQGDVIYDYGYSYGAGCPTVTSDCDGNKLCGYLWKDKGWNVPNHNPIRRAPVVYRRYWPEYWSGQPQPYLGPAPPTVYMPTDTTQLGFYYHRVPAWRPNPAMLPAAPWPPHYHDRSCRLRGGACPTGMPVEYMSPSGTPTPVDDAETAPPEPTPVPDDGHNTALSPPPEPRF